MKDHDLPDLLHAWVIHGAPDEALDDSDRELLQTANGVAPIASNRSSSSSVGVGAGNTIRDEHDYVIAELDAPRRRRSHRPLMAAAAAAVLLIGMWAIIAAVRSTPPEVVALAPGSGSPDQATAAWKAGPCAGPVVRGPQSERSAEQQAAADQASKNLSDEIARTGFGFYSAPTQTGGWVCGWVPVGTGIDGAKTIVSDKGGEAVYDAPEPDAGILGYNFADLGFFTVDEVQDPGFDPGQLRIERYGCDTVTTEWCRSPETILGNGRPPEYQQG